MWETAWHKHKTHTHTHTYTQLQAAGATCIIYSPTFEPTHTSDTGPDRSLKPPSQRPSTHHAGANEPAPCAAAQEHTGPGLPLLAGHGVRIPVAEFAGEADEVARAVAGLRPRVGQTCTCAFVAGLALAPADAVARFFLPFL